MARVSVSKIRKEAPQRGPKKGVAPERGCANHVYIIQLLLFLARTRGTRNAGVRCRRRNMIHGSSHPRIRATFPFFPLANIFARNACIIICKSQPERGRNILLPGHAIYRTIL
jgi:hypothetical protein